MKIISNKQYVLQISTTYYSIAFSVDGKMQSMTGRNKEKERLHRENPGKGFYILLDGTIPIPLSELKYQDGYLYASSHNHTQTVVLEVRIQEEYCRFIVKELIGVPTTNALSLHFEVNCIGYIRALDTDYMTFCTNPSKKNEVFDYVADNALIGQSAEEKVLRVDFNYIWNRNAENPLGSFALYAPESEEEEDEIILRIWVKEQLPHPAVSEEWNLECARRWVSEWQAMFAQRNQLMLEANSLDDLYEGAEFAIQSECNEVYLFTNSWRNAGFWPENELNWGLRKDLYPNGEKDLREYSDYLWSHGIRLNIHYVSGGLGFHDPEYVVKPHPQLASYGEFLLAGELEQDTDTIYLKVKGTVQLPYLIEHVGSWNYHSPGMPEFFGFHFFQIKDEIVYAQEIEHTNSEVWVLKGCRRGINSVQLTHQVGEEAKGLIDTYGINFIPDNDSELLKEIAQGYASFLNRCHISHTEYDGAEIHDYNGRWGYEKFATYVYQTLDHPVTAHDSGATQPKCYMEYRFNKSKRLMKGTCPYTHGNYSIPLVLDTPGRIATSLLDANYTLSQGIQGGAMGFAKPEPMFGVSPQMLRSHGLLNQFVDVLKDWRSCAAILTEEQKEKLTETFVKPKVCYEQSNHIANGTVYEIEKVGGRMNLVPIHVMKRKEHDILWQHCQEHGPIGPKQFIRMEESLTLFNPYYKQIPKFLIRMNQAYEYDKKTENIFDYEHILDQASAQTDFVVAGNSVYLERKYQVNENLLLQVDAQQIVPQGLTNIQIENNQWRIKAENPYSDEIWEAYKLPEFYCRVDMTHHRGIGLTVTGDGSGAILLIQIPGRDYIIPIDFEGTKYVEILNGEVSWHDSRWGWRMATKSTRYDNVDKFRIGFGYLPPQTTTSIQVCNIKLLDEISTTIRNPVISNSSGRLIIQGEVTTGEYLSYEGGEFVNVLDSNFFLLKSLPVENQGFEAEPGWDTYHFDCEESKETPWLSVQMMVKGESFI